MKFVISRVKWKCCKTCNVLVLYITTFIGGLTLASLNNHAYSLQFHQLDLRRFEKLSKSVEIAMQTKANQRILVS